MFFMNIHNHRLIMETSKLQRTAKLGKNHGNSTSQSKGGVEGKR